MSDSSAFDFSKFVPGFDFLKKLSSSGATAMPQASSWIAPTLDPQELEKRIQELKAVHFWLDQNTKAVSATIQALEVQRMTLATLKGMNFSMNDLAEALKAKPAEAAAPNFSFTTPAPETAAAAAPTEVKKPAKPKKPQAKAAPQAQSPQAAASGAVDPLAWWGSLTEQFQQIAGQAMQDMQRNAQAAQTAQAANPQSAPADKPAAATPAKAAPKKTPAAKKPAARRP
ncbi:MAG: hypothetical protein FGM21_02275 [Limnohabitans sp.]|jgi:hypothetical protein|nr:hypothetical protein [Limnohabitans sp.]